MNFRQLVDSSDINEGEISFRSAQDIIDANQENKIGDVVLGRRGTEVKGSQILSLSKDTMVFVTESAITELRGKDKSETIIYISKKQLKASL